MQLMSGGLWEGLIFLAFGPLLSWGAYYVQTRKLSLLGAVVSLPLVWRAVCLAPHTAKTDLEFVAAQALTIQTHFFMGLAAWW